MLASLSLNLAVLLGPAEGDDEPRLAVVQVPGRLPRLVRPPGVEGLVHVLLEDVIWADLQDLFPGQEIRDVAAFRITRDAELDFDDEGGRDFLQLIEEELKNRRRNEIVRLEVQDGVSETLLKLLMSARSRWAPRTCTRSAGRSTSGPDAARRPAAARGPARPAAQAGGRGRGRARPETLRACSTRRTSLLHHPYESFDPVVALVARPPTTPTCSPSSRRSTARAATRPIVRALGARRRERQAGDGAGRADGALRRAVEHPLGAEAGGVGRATSSTASAASRPTPRSAGGAARAPGHPALRPPRHRQLQRADRPRLHRLRAHDRRDRRSARTPRPSSTRSPATPTRRA